MPELPGRATWENDTSKSAGARGAAPPPPLVAAATVLAPASPHPSRRRAVLDLPALDLLLRLGLPPGTRVTDAVVNAGAGILHLVVEHEALLPVPDPGVIPYVVPLWEWRDGQVRFLGWNQTQALEEPAEAIGF